jgi:hypothetical protein
MTYFREANLSSADLSYGNFVGAYFFDANLRCANLSHADLSFAVFTATDLRDANLSNANLSGAVLIGASLTRAVLVNCIVYGISAWDVELEESIQADLIITQENEPLITVDNLKVAQFIYLLLNNAEVRGVIDAITSKVVLILGRFTPERKAVLDALRDELRKHNLLPVVFDFERPISRDFTETVTTLAYLSRFIIADITGPRSIPQELQAIVSSLAVPVQPILQAEEQPYGMFPDFGKYTWVLPVYKYMDQASLLASLHHEIIEPADKKARELAIEKAKRLESL